MHFLPVCIVLDQRCIVFFCVGFVVSVDSEDLNGELDDVGQQSRNGVISSEFQQALSTHFDSSSSHRDNKDIGKSRIIELVSPLHHCFL